MTESDCIFCRIVAGEIPATVVAETDRVLAILDIEPKAPVHVLVLPKSHLVDITDVAAAHPDVLAEMVSVASEIADAECGGQFKFIFNTGPKAGQSVFHAHGHVIGGIDPAWSAV